MQLRAQGVPALLEHAPVVVVIGAPEHHRSDLDSALPHTLSSGRCVAPALNGVKTELPLQMGPGTLIFCPFATPDDRAPMSRRTAQLLNRPAPARSVWRDRFGEAANLLVAQYGIPRLGNYLDPIREIFYILLSAKTSDNQYRRTFQRLTTRFPSLSGMAEADVKQILPLIASGGLANKKAGQIKRTAAALVALGDDPAQRLREMGDEELFAFLTQLPGMGPKSAFCVMMYSLQVDVFPVDANVQRIAARMGAIPKGLKHYQAQQRLPGLIAPNRSRELHITMVAHGREVCLPRKPRCSECCLRELCKQGRASTEAENRTVARLPA